MQIFGLHSRPSYFSLTGIRIVFALKNEPSSTGVTVAIRETSRRVADTQTVRDGHRAGSEVRGRQVSGGTQVAERSPRIQVRIRDHEVTIRDVLSVRRSRVVCEAQGQTIDTAN